MSQKRLPQLPDSADRTSPLSYLRSPLSGISWAPPIGLRLFILRKRQEYVNAERVFRCKWQSRIQENDDEGQQDRAWEMASFYNWLVCLAKLGRWDTVDSLCRRQRVHDLGSYFWVDFINTACFVLRGGDTIQTEARYQNALIMLLQHQHQLATSVPATAGFEALFTVRALRLDCLALVDSSDGVPDLIPVDDYTKIHRLDQSSQP